MGRWERSPGGLLVSRASVLAVLLLALDSVATPIDQRDVRGEAVAIGTTATPPWEQEESAEKAIALRKTPSLGTTETPVEAPVTASIAETPSSTEVLKEPSSSTTFSTVAKGKEIPADAVASPYEVNILHIVTEPPPDRQQHVTTIHNYRPYVGPILKGSTGPQGVGYAPASPEDYGEATVSGYYPSAESSYGDSDRRGGNYKRAESKRPRYARTEHTQDYDYSGEAGSRPVERNRGEEEDEGYSVLGRGRPIGVVSESTYDEDPPGEAEHSEPVRETVDSDGYRGRDSHFHGGSDFEDGSTEEDDTPKVRKVKHHKKERERSSYSSSEDEDDRIPPNHRPSPSEEASPKVLNPRHYKRPYYEDKGEQSSNNLKKPFDYVDYAVNEEEEPHISKSKHYKKPKNSQKNKNIAGEDADNKPKEYVQSSGHTDHNDSPAGPGLSLSQWNTESGDGPSASDLYARFKENNNSPFVVFRKETDSPSTPSEATEESETEEAEDLKPKRDKKQRNRSDSPSSYQVNGDYIPENHNPSPSEETSPQILNPLEYRRPHSEKEGRVSPGVDTSSYSGKSRHGDRKGYKKNSEEEEEEASILKPKHFKKPKRGQTYSYRDGEDLLSADQEQKQYVQSSDADNPVKTESPPNEQDSEIDREPLSKSVPRSRYKEASTPFRPPSRQYPSTPSRNNGDEVLKQSPPAETTARTTGYHVREPSRSDEQVDEPRGVVGKGDDASRREGAVHRPGTREVSERRRAAESDGRGRRRYRDGARRPAAPGAAGGDGSEPSKGRAPTSDRHRRTGRRESKEEDKEKTVERGNARRHWTEHRRSSSPGNGQDEAVSTTRTTVVRQEDEALQVKENTITPTKMTYVTMERRPGRSSWVRVTTPTQATLPDSSTTSTGSEREWNLRRGQRRGPALPTEQKVDGQDVVTPAPIQAPEVEKQVQRRRGHGRRRVSEEDRGRVAMQRGPQHPYQGYASKAREGEDEETEETQSRGEERSAQPRHRPSESRRRDEVEEAADEEEDEEEVEESGSDRVEAAEEEDEEEEGDGRPADHSAVTSDQSSSASGHGGGGGGGGGDKKFEKGDGEEHHEKHHSEHGEKGDKGYKGHHDFEKKAHGKHGKEEHKGEYEEEEGKKDGHHEGGGFYGDHHEGHKGKKEEGYNEEGAFKKGHSTKGSHEVHRKDEYSKKHEFFDDDGEAGHHEKEGGYKEDYGGKKGGHHKSEHHKSGSHQDHYGKKGKHKKGHYYDEEDGHDYHDGHEEHHGHKEEYHKKGGKEGHKKFGHSEGDGGGGGGGGGGGKKEGGGGRR